MGCINRYIKTEYESVPIEKLSSLNATVLQSFEEPLVKIEVVDQYGEIRTKRNFYERRIVNYTDKASAIMVFVGSVTYAVLRKRQWENEGLKRIDGIVLGAAITPVVLSPFYCKKFDEVEGVDTIVHKEFLRNEAFVVKDQHSDTIGEYTSTKYGILEIPIKDLSEDTLLNNDVKIILKWNKKSTEVDIPSSYLQR